MLRVASWNVNGATSSTAEIDRLVKSCDVVCLQEIKQKTAYVPPVGYTCIWNPAERSHLWGTAIVAKVDLKPELVGVNITATLQDEGRTVAIKLKELDVIVLCVYVPNSGVGAEPLKRLGVRLEWDKDLWRAIEQLPFNLILAGDMNVAVREIDVHNPATLRRKAGFTDEERESFMTNFGQRMASAWVTVHGPDAKGFTFWGKYPGLKENDKGWRLDYQLFRGGRIRVRYAQFLREYESSDHVPLVASYTIHESKATNREV